jgi:hypothetical protein
LKDKGIWGTNADCFDSLAQTRGLWNWVQRLKKSRNVPNHDYGKRIESQLGISLQQHKAHWDLTI